MSDRALLDRDTRFAPLQPRQLLARLLEEPELVALVQALSPRTLGTLIQQIGLEDCGEIISLATTAQLERIMDDDLWRSAGPGQDESFHADRFAVWLELMLEAGEDFVAEKLVELPEEMVTLALQKHILVLNLVELETELLSGSKDVYRTEQALDGCLSHEIGEYQVISKRHEGWDAVLTVLTGLDRDHHHFLQGLLARCCAMSAEYIDDNGGLYEVLTSEEMLESDGAAAREERRAREGFIAPSAAVSFLALARTTAVQEIADAAARDPITAGYFRDLEIAADPHADETEGRAARLVEMLRRAQVEPDGRAVPLLEGTQSPGTTAADAAFQSAMGELRQHDADAYSRRMEELAYLANVLVAGCTFAGRSFRPFEAAEAVVATCNLGLECRLHQAAGTPTPTASELLMREGADKLFRLGWRLLHEEISLPAGAAFLRLLAREPRDGTDRQGAMERARAEKAFRSALAAGKPWVLHAKLGRLELDIDEDARAKLEGLLDQCPSLPATRAGAEDGAAEFLSTRARLAEVHRLLADL